MIDKEKSDRLPKKRKRTENQDSNRESPTAEKRMESQGIGPECVLVTVSAPRIFKVELDKMNDRDYMAAVMEMGQEEKESLMVSEAERLRTYRTLWPNPPFLHYRHIAREGFYYTGNSDQVQCAFCSGTLGNWEKGDDPKKSHQKFYRQCKMAQGEPCGNLPLPYEECKPASDSSLFDRADSKLEPIAKSCGIRTRQPKHPARECSTTRLCTYAHYPSSCPMPAEELNEAGFFYEGPGDKVRCFWCDGELELWSSGDDAWKEHAKWYPGCSFVQELKGEDFIRQCRSEMTAEELEDAQLLEYHSNGTNFLNHREDGMDWDEAVGFSVQETL